MKSRQISLALFIKFHNQYRPPGRQNTKLRVIWEVERIRYRDDKDSLHIIQSVWCWTSLDPKTRSFYGTLFSFQTTWRQFYKGLVFACWVQLAASLCFWMDYWNALCLLLFRILFVVQGIFPLFALYGQQSPNILAPLSWLHANTALSPLINFQALHDVRQPRLPQASI